MKRGPSKIEGHKPEYIAGRYRIEQLLGQGGMATVYRVFDEANSKESALKLLSKDASESAHLSALFEREFHTLAQLAHPRIIEVYDFGVDTRGAYYTMELLDGADLRKLAPLNWKEACKLLRDVASSLALLHSRRLLHRDVSSRNVRCTRDGRAKLIDLGAMVPFGTPVKPVGTPAFIAPESLNYQPLDQRTDLYALGVLAYWLITKRYPYRAHHMATLPDVWRTQPLPLSVLNPEAPKTLSNLVMSLLSLDRMARPSCASEVVETLEACAGLERDDTVEVKQAYLTTPQLVGRAAVISELRKRILTMLAGHGGETLLLEGPSGIGRSRLLAELVLEGKVIGATVLATGAEASVRGGYGVIWALLERLFESAYDVASEVIKEHVEVLSGVFPDLIGLLLSRTLYKTDDTFRLNTVQTDDNLVVDSPQTHSFLTTSLSPSRWPSSAARAGQNRLQIQKTLLDFFLKINRARRLVIAIDDIHRIDEPSAALLAALALKSPNHAFVLAVTAETGATPTAPGAYATLLRTARRVDIQALDMDGTEALLRSIFGDVAHVHTLTDRIYGISKGNPRAVTQLAQHLVNRGNIRYQSGAWILPSGFKSGDLPNSITDALKAKVRELSVSARRFAQTMAFSPDQRFLLEECLLLAGHGDIAQLTRDINELAAQEVLAADDVYYALSQPDWAPILTEGLDDEVITSSHLRLAQFYQTRGDEPLRVVQHLLFSGQEDAALDLLIEHMESTFESPDTDRYAFAEYIQSRPRGWDDICRNALALSERRGRPRRHIFVLQRAIIRSRFATSEENWTLIAKVIDQLYRDSGLDIYDTLSKDLDDHKRLQDALERAHKRYDATPEFDRVTAPSEAVGKLAETILDALDIGTVMFDYRLVASLPSVKPLIPTLPALALVEKHREAIISVVAGRFEHARQLFIEILETLLPLDDDALKGAYRKYWSVNITYGIGLIEAGIGLRTALLRADEIEPDLLFQVNAWRIRFLYYLRQAEARKAEQCQKLLELLRVQNGHWQFYEGLHLFPVTLAYASYDDLNELAKTIDYLQLMANRGSGWLPIFHYAQGEYHRIRGDYQSAKDELEKALELTAPGLHAVWPYAAGAHTKVLFELGRLEEARKLGFERLEAAQKEKYGYLCSFIQMPLALVEAKLGQEESAEKLADAVIDGWIALNATGVYLGVAYETRARVAILTDDPKSFRKYSKLCGEQYRTGYHPALTVKHQKLMQDARFAYIGLSQETKQSSELALSLSQGGDILVGVHSYLARYNSYDELIHGALDLMIKRTGSSDGYLYLLKNNELRLAGQTGADPLPDSTLRALKEYFTASSVDKTEAEADVSQTGSGVWHHDADEFRAVEQVILSARIDGRMVVIGAAVLCLSDRRQFLPDSRFFEAVTLCLYERLRDNRDDTKSTAARGESRYTMEVLLGEGGTASVYKVHDRETERSVALKRVRVDSNNDSAKTKDPTETALRKKRREGILRREYQTLKSLAHPRIIEVYEFGIDQEGAYYTMELLDGADLRQLAPLEWKPACVLLRDLASALALLHSRRLLHRDVSPRNVRLTADGHIKLMDFGAMIPMGVPKDSVGTPPFVPPEVVYRQQLDQRSDLYSFGALAYWLLTGRHAYPVRRPTDLRDAWLIRPPSPAEEVKALGTLDEIPESLDRLVMSLLSLDRLARPSSAAEVMERLSAIADLPADEQLAVPRAYLTTPTLVGRHEALLTVKKRVNESLKERGGAVTIEGPEGVGRSRFLDACVMEGKLAGMVVLRVEAKDGQSGPYSAVQMLGRQLLTEIPEIAIEEAKRYQTLLRLIMPELLASENGNQGAEPNADDQNGSPSFDSGTTQSARAQVQAALTECIRAISRRRSLMIAVDDIHRIDEPSSAFLALLANKAFDRMVVLAVTSESGAPCTSPNALGLIREAGVCIYLKDLNNDDTQKLLLSVFGDVPNIRLMADRIYMISRGNARTVLELAQHLVDQGVVRYQSGAWTLPSRLDASDMPSSIKEALTARIGKLDSDALTLAQAIALSLQQSLSYEECIVLTEHRDHARLMQSLDTLVAADILSTDGAYYAFCQQRWVAALLEGLAQSDRRMMHSRLAELFEGSESGQFRLTQHLLFAGYEDRALDVFIRYIEKVRERFEKNRETILELINYPPSEWEGTITALIGICEKRGGSKYHIYLLHYAFVIVSTISVIPDKSYLLSVIQRLYRDSCLDIYETLGDSVDKAARLGRALELGQERYEASPDADRVLSPGQAIGDLARAYLTAINIAGTSLDHALIASLPSVEPLVALSPAFDVLQKNIQSTANILAARLEQAHRGYLEILERFEQPDRGGMSATLYVSGRFTVKWAVAVIEASWGLKSALRWADELEQHPVFEVNAWRIRRLYYMRQGDVYKAGKCKTKLELLALQSNAHYFEGTQLTSEVYVYSFSDDLLGVKSTIDDIENLAGRFTGWIPILHFAKGEYHRIRGDFASAIKALEQSLTLIEAGRHILWPYGAGAYINALFEAGLVQESQTSGRKLLAQAEAADLGLSCNYIRGPLAKSEAKLGQRERAIALSEMAIQSWKSIGTIGLNLGLAYENRARVALYIRDHEGFVEHALLCGEQYRAGRNPALAAKYARLIGEAEEAGIEKLPKEDNLFDNEHIDSEPKD